MLVQTCCGATEAMCNHIWHLCVDASMQQRKTTGASNANKLPLVR